MSAYEVKKIWEGFVPPSEATPSTTLSLSWIDKIPSNKSMMDSVLVFKKGGESPAKVIKEALSKALVPYYPVAGVFAFSEEQGELQVVCNGDGVWFVEAVADCTLDHLAFLINDIPLFINQQQFIPQGLIPGMDPTDRMLLMQVTEFKCGGFVLGLKGNHAIWDGIGSAQFIKAVADIAKGEQKPNPEPVWHRHLLPVPESLPEGLRPPPKHIHTPKTYPPILQLPSNLITKLKTHISHKLNKPCSSFDVIAAKIWQARARAMHANNYPNVENHHLVISMNIRHILKEIIPPGFYGNCIHLVTLSMQSCKLVSEPLHELVKMIRDAKEGLPVDYFEWVKKGKNNDADDDDDGGSLMGSSSSVVVTDWTRLGYLEADFGWGCPVNFFPVLSEEHDQFASSSCLILKGPEGQDGLRLVAQCVEKDELGVFYDELMSLAEFD